jgi:hypothetical protein
MTEKEINITFTLEQVNAVLQRLGQLPYAQVADLVEGIKAVALPQIPPPEEKPEE